MFFAYLRRGVKAGVVAGLVFGLLVALVANPLVAFADELAHGGDQAGEHGHEHAAETEGHAGGSHHDSAVSMAMTNSVSVVSGVLWGVLLGVVVFGVAYYFLEPLLPGTGATKSVLLAAAGFLTVSGGPWLVLPPQPPGVEQSLPTDTRLLLYGGMMAATALVSLSAFVAYDRLRATRSRARSAVVAVVPYSLLAVPVALVPTNGVANTVPAEVATGLTGLIVFGQVLLWLTLAGTHAWLSGRSDDQPVGDVGTELPDGPPAAD
ncbi:CbtA family protein [Haloarcula halophila]|uniref:CbtA family protein n=1 Tax=Haloarcula TaxID=2237 RepID=UPI00361E0749